METDITAKSGIRGLLEFFYVNYTSYATNITFVCNAFRRDIEGNQN